MAAQSKKKNSSTKKVSSPKKSTLAKSSKQTKNRRTKRVKRALKRRVVTTLLLLSALALVLFGYFLGESNAREGIKFGLFKEGYTTEQLLKDISQIKEKQTEVKSAKSTLKEHSVERSLFPKYIIHQEVIADKVRRPQGRKAKLAIIIDDVSSRRQLQKLKALHMKVTPSIFPPFRGYMHSHKLANGLKHYMIHLPMESGSVQFNSQYKTLMRSDSKQKVVQRAKELRFLFPTAKYINNHTGSVFTADYLAMCTLYGALKEEGFIFVDSLTTGASKVPQIAKEFGDRYRVRDIFLDNIQTVPAIHKQLRSAVRKAKKKGYAIAIGHTHKVTMRALKGAKDILKGVELVYIDEIIKE